VKGHLDADTVAAFREDLLPGRKAAQVAAHLAACPQCAEIDAQLTAVTSILAHAPTPPMPASLAARLDAALAAEVAARAAGTAGMSTTGTSTPAQPSPGPASPGHAGPGRAGPGSTGPGSTGPGRTGPGHAGPGRTGPGSTGRRRRAAWSRSGLSLRLATVAAAVVLVAGGGYAVARLVSASTGGVAGSSAGASEPHSALSRRAAPALGPEAAGAAAGLRVVESGTDYRPGQVRAQVGAVLKRYPATRRVPGSATTFAPAATLPPGFPQLAGCLRRLADGARPRLVDLARYGTRPAAIIVLPVTGRPTLRVLVVGTGCSARGSDLITSFTLPSTG